MSISRFTPYAVVLGAFVLANATLARVGPSHFIPEQTLATLRGRDPRVLLLGNSLMDAGYVGTDHDVANVAVGATDPPEHRFFLRQVLAEGRHPKRVVYGWFAGQLLPREVHSADIVGNRIAIATWATPADVTEVFPGFPFAHTSDGANFVAMTELPLFRYGPLLQSKIEVRRRALASSARAEDANQFGRVDDFRKLAEDQMRSLPTELERSRREHDEFVLSPHILALRELAHQSGAHVVWLSMPMTRASHDVIEGIASYQPFVESARRQLVAPGDDFLDASSLPELQGNSMFSDGLHLGPNGAKVFTAWLDARLAELDRTNGI